MCRLVDNKASRDDDDMASENEDMKVAAVPREEYLERKAKHASSQMSSMDTNEIIIAEEIDMNMEPLPEEDMKVARVSQETHKKKKKCLYRQ